MTASTRPAANTMVTALNSRPFGRPWSRCLLVPLSWVAATGLAQTPESVGTLFFNAKERDAIVAGRNASTDQAPLPTVMSLSGVVTRSNGKSTAWINGQAVREGESPMPGVPLVIGHGVVKVNKHSLRIGESLDLTSQQRTDILPAQAVTRKP